MKVLLIDVPFNKIEIGGVGTKFGGVLNVIPSLGLAYLAAVSEKAGHDTNILDCNLEPSYQKIKEKCRSFKPDVVGVNAATPTFLNAVKTVELAREIIPGAVFIAGGSHPTAMPEHTLSSGVFDYVVIGEGEDTFCELLKHISGEGSKPENIPGLAFYKNKKLVITSPRHLIEDLNKLPFPARHLLPPLKSYSPTPASYRKLPMAHIMTSRGCPCRCRFCDRSVFGEKYRERNAENVLKEVEEVVRVYGAREIRFFDDCFTINKERLIKICEGLKRIKKNLLWTCLTNVNFVDREILKIMKDAGCWQILYGLESGDKEILKSIGKGTTLEQNERAVRWANETGLRVRADFLVGSPQETKESLIRTLNFAVRLPIDFAHFNKFIPFPGTQFYRQLKEEGFELDLNKNLSVLNHGSEVFIPAGISKKDFRYFLDTAYKKFYFRPGYILRRLFCMRSFTELTGQFKGFFSLI